VFGCNTGNVGLIVFIHNNIPLYILFFFLLWFLYSMTRFCFIYKLRFKNKNRREIWWRMMSGIFGALGEISWFYLWMWQEDGDDERLSSSWLNPVEGTLLVKEPSAYKVLKFFFFFTSSFCLALPESSINHCHVLVKPSAYFSSEKKRRREKVCRSSAPFPKR